MKAHATFITWVLFIGGCGGSYVPMYASVSAACLAQERSIVDRQGTTEEQDRTDLASIRNVCDDLLLRIEQESTR